MVETGSLSSTAAVATRHGGPNVVEVRAFEVAPPEPGEVRVRVEAAGISYADLLMCQGLHPERRRAPFVPGWDVVGEVESVGSEIRDVAAGDRVTALSIVGDWAEYAVVPGSLVVPVPPPLESTAAACLVMDHVVAYQMLTRSTSVRQGRTASDGLTIASSVPGCPNVESAARGNSPMLGDHSSPFIPTR